MDLPIHEGATGPFVVSGFGGYRQQQNPRASCLPLTPAATTCSRALTTAGLSTR